MQPPSFASPSKCAGCKERYYCSRACQKVHWKAGHKAQCPVLKARREERATAARSTAHGEVSALVGVEARALAGPASD